MDHENLHYYGTNYDLCVSLGIYDKRSNMSKEHFHKSYELYYLMSGERNLYVEDKFLVAKAGTLIIIPPNCPHKALSLSGTTYKRLLINFIQDIIPQYLLTDSGVKKFFSSGLKVFKLEGSTIDAYNTFTKNVLRILKDKKEGYELGIYSEFLRIFTHIVQLNAYSENAEVFSETKRIQTIVSDVAKYIEANYSEELSLEKLSKLFYLSPSYLSRSFKKYRGIALLDYINFVRVAEVKNQLDYLDKKADELTKACGFKSVSNMNKMFKKIMKTSPHQYRIAKKIESKNNGQ